MAASLLPPNATRQERCLEAAIGPAPILESGVDGILTFKEAPPDNALLFLVWEYGLEELLPYLSSPRDVIEKGIPWERIKGTLAAIRMALSWLTSGQPAIEEEIPAGAHWFEFMLDPGHVPDDRAEVETAIALARLSAPIGTILSRMYHGYDRRRLILDGSAFGDPLSDNSGRHDSESGLVLSFGRTIRTSVALDDGGMAECTRMTRSHAVNDRYDDRVLWDFGRFGDVAVRNHPFHHSHLFQVAGQGVLTDQIVAVSRLFPKAAVVLSDGYILGDTNAALFAFDTLESGNPAPLSDGLRLSGEPWRLRRRPIDERFDRFTAGVGAYAADPWSRTGCDEHRYSVASNGYTDARQNMAVLYGLSTSQGRVHGQYWVGIPWVPQSWGDVEFTIRTTYHGDTA